MARYKTGPKKSRLAKQGKHTKWAPFWLIPKVYGKGKRVHPSRLTRLKRNWRRDSIKTKIKVNKIHRIRARKVPRKY